MAFDQTTRNRLAGFVAAARELLTEEFARQLQQDYGLDPRSGDVAAMEKLTYLDDARRETATLLRATLEHYLAGVTTPTAKARQEALVRIVREQAFTVLNRLCALRMAEARGLLIESVAAGYQSRGFQLYGRLAGTALGETGDAYRCYLYSVFDELAIDLPVLFDRWSPQGRLFPRESALLQLLDQINHPDIDALWCEDETIGWIYQYFNSKEERKAMRDASRAPRNSRELAVRNQFFTPRYVVEFLTDNTLGRIWYEMTRGETGLVDTCRYLVRRPNEIFLAQGEQAPAQDTPVEDLSQEQLLQQPVYIPHRPFKDPRDLKMLDPACGSMHFGLYAFDLFARIYEEAWEIEATQGATALGRSGEMSLTGSYPSKEALLRDVPRLIVERNIHGIDIDPRAVQIAGLSLWLRAQKSWHDQELKPQERPEIRRSNIVCAEPMPGDAGLLQEFIARHLSETAEDRVIGAMLPPIFDAMRLAGEAGSLLKIEEEIAGIVQAARREYERAVLQRRKEEGYLPGLAPDRDTTLYDLLELPNPEQFWLQAEGRIYATLHAYAESAEGGDSYRRRLFAGDAARGFAFIDLCREQYDVVLMNPPFGELSKDSMASVEQAYPQSKGNILAHFLERAAALTSFAGKVGAIVSRACFFLTSLSAFREEILGKQLYVDAFADLGSGVLDAMVETAAAVFHSLEPTTNEAVFVRLLVSEQKDTELRENVESLRMEAASRNLFVIAPRSFNDLDDTPYVYWITPSIIKRIASYPTLQPEGCDIRVGLQTGDDFRFLRQWYEVAQEQILDVPNILDTAYLQRAYLESTRRDEAWAWYSKIDEASPFAASIHLLVNWSSEGRQIKAAHIQNGDSISRYVRSEETYFLPGVSYMRRSSRLLPYVVPWGVIPTAGRSQIYPVEGKEQWVLTLVASNVASAVARFRGEKFEWPMFQNSMVASVPFVDQPACLQGFETQKLEAAIQNQKSLFAASETCIEFVTISDSLKPSRLDPLDRSSLLGKSLDLHIGKTFGFSEGDMSILERDLMDSVNISAGVSGLDDEMELTSQSILEAAPYDNFHSVISYSLGTAFGRWDIRYSTGEKRSPDMPDAFAPLPVCPPGMLQNAQGLPADPADVPADYPLRISWPGILADDEGHAEDIERRVRNALHVIWKERADAIEQEACHILGVPSLRASFRKPGGFFADHLSRYSKSRRQAPIYWPLSTPSGSYTLWLYYHRLTDQTLYTCVNDFVDPKLKQVAEDVSLLRQKAGRTRAEEKELERLSDLQLELQEFRAELLRIAAFWKPNLNDGVQITAAPLWRLFQHRPWRTRLKETWEKLEAGEYDWAHLAYSIWPDRVREKCRTDKSLAIAHDLEELFVAPPVQPKEPRGRTRAGAPASEG